MQGFLFALQLIKRNFEGTMGKQKGTDVLSLKCKHCGVELTEENSYERADGISDFCVECEEEIYNQLVEQMGYSLALYLCCVKFNVPCEPMLIPDNFKEKDFESGAKRWSWYLDTLVNSDKFLAKDGNIRSFADGVTNIFRIFGKEMSEKDFSRYCQYERSQLEQLQGTAEQRQRWGTKDITKGLPMTTAIYNELDNAYKIKVSRYKGVTLDEVLESTLKRLVMLEMAQEYLRSIGDFAGFDKVQKSIDNISASEQLRRKDQKPVEELRIDALVTALENAGLMENGDLLTYDEVVEVLRDKFVKSKKYDYSLDVADQMMLDIINSMRYNADLAQIQDLPEEFAPIDEYGEFEPEETEREKEAKAFLGVTKVNVIKRKKGGKK